MRNLTMIAATAMIAACFMPAPASAEQYIQNGSGVCKSALPVFDGNIRNRPLAISNEGTGLAFVSCSMLDRLGNESDIVGVWLHNRTGASVDMTCTFINGHAGFSPTYFPRTQTYAAGTGGYILWGTPDNGGLNFGIGVNLSCGLPPGTELRFVTFNATTNL